MNERDLCNMSQPEAREARIAELVTTIAEACEVIRGLLGATLPARSREQAHSAGRDFLWRMEGGK